MKKQKVRLSDREMKCLAVLAEQREQWELIDPLDANEETHALCTLAIQNLDWLHEVLSGSHVLPAKQETVEQQLLAPVVSMTPLVSNKKDADVRVKCKKSTKTIIAETFGCASEDVGQSYQREMNVYVVGENYFTCCKKQPVDHRVWTEFSDQFWAESAGTVLWVSEP